MPCWYYDKKDLRNTPSIRDGLDFENECRYRKEGTLFIKNCGIAMVLGHHTIATGTVYFHRFYMFHTFKEFPRYVTACCCLFLAGKVEETPKKCRDIITTARSMLPNDQKFQAFSEDLRKAKDELMTLESILLQTMKFDLEVQHPYNFLIPYAKCLKGDKMKLNEIPQMAWNFVNDSLSLTVCLQWEPEVIAVALIHLACKIMKISIIDWTDRQTHHSHWWDMFISDVTMEILEDICHQVLDLYEKPNYAQNNESSSKLKSKCNNNNNESCNHSTVVHRMPSTITDTVNVENRIIQNSVEINFSTAATANRFNFANSAAMNPPLQSQKQKNGMVRYYLIIDLRNIQLATCFNYFLYV